MNEAKIIEHLDADLRALQFSLKAVEVKKSTHITQTSYMANQQMQITMTALTGILAAIELVGNGTITHELIEKNSDPFYRIAGVVSIFIFLVLSLIIGKVSVRRAADAIGDDVDSYTKRHFQYLLNQKHSLDLAIKFIVVSAFILGQKPEWVAPLLFVFTADYLFQSRYFTLDTRRAMGLGIFTISMGITEFYLDSPSVAWPLIWFFALNLYSLSHLKTLKRIED